MDHDELQRSWDAQQDPYVPGREERLGLMLRLVERAAGARPRVLDLAGGTGSITRRLLDRLPGATSVIVDMDPVLLAIAEATFAGDGRVQVCDLDLREPTWSGALPDAGAGFDAVLTATALHWLEPERLIGLYAELGGLLRPGGVFANSDHLPDAGLTAMEADLADLEEQAEVEARTDTAAPDWAGWWEELRGQPDLAAAFAARDARRDHDPVGGHTQSTAPADWHLAALRDAGFTRTGVVWRHLREAVVLGVLA